MHQCCIKDNQIISLLQITECLGLATGTLGIKIVISKLLRVADDVSTDHLCHSS
jgi:hypothetical protein